MKNLQNLSDLNEISEVVIWWKGYNQWCIFPPNDHKNILKVFDSPEQARQYCEDKGYAIHTDASKGGELKYFPDISFG